MGSTMMMREEEEEEAKAVEEIVVPVLDLRCFDGDELLLMAQLSGQFPDPSVCDFRAPKLDRTCFNESAGSRRQTWGKSSRHASRGLGKVATASSASARQGANAEIAHDVAVSEQPMRGGASSSRSAKVAVRVVSDSKGRVKGAERRVSWKKEVTGRRFRGNDSSRIAIREEGHSLEILGSGQELARTEPEHRKSGRATKRARQDAGTRGVKRSPLQEIAGGSGLSFRKKLRQAIVDRNGPEQVQEIGNRKRSGAWRDSSGDSEALVKSKKARDGNLVHTVVGGPSFASAPLDVIQGHGCLETGRNSEEGDMRDRLAKMKGRWVSNERARKIIHATGFPVGWTVHVGLKYKNGRTLFEYGAWRSPDGKLWPSFKDASAFLLSSVGQASPAEIGVRLKPSPKSSPGRSCDKKAPVVKEEPFSEISCTCGENLTRISSDVEHMHPHDVHCQRPSEAQDVMDGGSCQFYGLCCCSRQVAGVHLEQMPNMPRPAIGGEGTSFADHSRFSGDHRTVLNTAETLHKWLAGCKVCCRTTIKGVIDKHRCRQLTRTDGPSPENGVGKFEKNLRLDANTWGMECTENSVLSNIRDAVLPNDVPRHKCSFCGMMFSTLLKLHRHLKRAKHMRYFKCEVCGRQFSSITFLLGHRVKMGHPRLTKSTSHATCLQARGSDPVACSSGSEIVNIVLGLLSDPHEARLSKMSTRNLKQSRDTLKTIEDEGEGKQDSIECKICHKVFNDCSKYLGHVSVHSKRRKKAATPDTLSERDTLKTVEDEGKEDAFKCKICHKVFSVCSKYWGHMSVHSKHRKDASALDSRLESDSNLLSSRVVDVKSNVMKLGRTHTGVEIGERYTEHLMPAVAQSVFWKLLDDSLPVERPNHELDPFRSEATNAP